MSKTVEISITPAGSVTVNAIGFKGKGCADATEMIEIAIGGAQKRDKKKKPEFFQPAGTGTQVKRTF